MKLYLVSDVLKIYVNTLGNISKYRARTFRTADIEYLLDSKLFLIMYHAMFRV